MLLLLQVLLFAEAVTAQRSRCFAQKDFAELVVVAVVDKRAFAGYIAFAAAAAAVGCTLWPVSVTS